VPLASLGEDKVANIQLAFDQVESHRQGLSHDQEGVFRMRSTMLTMTQEWQMDVSISINKDKTKFGLLNNAWSPNEMNRRQYLLYTTQANQLLENRRHAFGSSTTHGKDEFMPILERNLAKDVMAKHGRNFQNKKEIYLMQIRVGGKGGTGVCMKLD
jgi:hypothetical protein